MSLGEEVGHNGGTTPVFGVLSNKSLTSSSGWQINSAKCWTFGESGNLQRHCLETVGVSAEENQGNEAPPGSRGRAHQYRH